jgi:hypothetical protein
MLFNELLPLRNPTTSIVRSQSLSLQKRLNQTPNDRLNPYAKSG